MFSKIFAVISLLVSSLVVGCAYQNPLPPTSSSVDALQAGVPARLELSASPGMGAEGGTGRITARVLDAFGKTLPQQLVRFTASAGTLSDESVITDARRGRAHHDHRAGRPVGTKSPAGSRIDNLRQAA